MKRLLYLLLILFFTACFKDSEVFTPDPIVPIINVTTSIGGTVVDENNVPISGALVQLGTETKETDKNGVFIFRNEEVDSRKAYVKVAKAGYFPSARTIIPSDNAITSIRIKLLTNQEIGTIAVTTGGEIVLPGGAVINFPIDAVADYAGDIHVHAQYLNPMDSDLSWKMPGDLTGLNANNKTQAIGSFGMIDITLLGDNAETLELAIGKVLEVSLPVSYRFTF